MANDDPSEQPDDFSIYPHMDGIRPSAPWCLGDYGDIGALSPENLRELAERFNLPDAVLQTLSKEIGHCLDAGSAVNLVEVNRARAIKRANLPLEDVARLAKRIEQDIKKVSEILTPLSAAFAKGDADGAILETTVRKAGNVREATAGLYNAIDQLIKTRGAAADIAPHDKRRVGDNRRRRLVETCCYAWRDAERTLTYTTRSINTTVGQRHGELIEFIQAVVGMVTDPPGELSGETLRKDIDDFRKELSAPDTLLTPPEFG